MKTKEDVRVEIEEIMEKNSDIFKKSHCVPSFVELIDAAEKLKELQDWKNATVVKVSLSLPREMRDWALKEGKISLFLYVLLRRTIRKNCSVGQSDS